MLKRKLIRLHLQTNQTNSQPSYTGYAFSLEETVMRDLFFHGSFCSQTRTHCNPKENRSNSTCTLLLWKEATMELFYAKMTSTTCQQLSKPSNWTKSSTWFPQVLKSSLCQLSSMWLALSDRKFCLRLSYSKIRISSRLEQGKLAIWRSMESRFRSKTQKPGYKLTTVTWLTSTQRYHSR